MLFNLNKKNKDKYTCTWFINTFSKALEYYRDSPAITGVVTSEEEWNSILDKMAYHLYMMEIPNIFKERGIKDPTYIDFSLAFNIRERNKKLFFELFEEYFFYYK